MQLPIKSLVIIALLIIPVVPNTLAQDIEAETPNPGLTYYYETDAPVVEVEADVVVYGGTSGGVIAAVQASRMGKSAVLVEFGRHVGGLTAGGLTATDGANKKSPGQPDG
jgi:hypothetical protein